MATIINLDRFRAKVRSLKDKAARETGGVIVGFSQVYAIYVHENLESHHPVGQAKFLEQPAREMTNDGTFRNMIRAHVQGGGTIKEGLLLAGLRLQREAQLRVPVDTGALKGSAFTAFEEDAPAAAQAAHKASEKHRKGATRSRAKAAKKARKFRTWFKGKQ